MRGRPHSLEWWIGVVRLSAVPFAVLQVSLTTGLSTADERTAWALVAALAVGAVVLFATVGDGTSRLHTAISMVFDFSILGAFVILYAFEQGTPTRQLLLIGVVAGAIRYGMVGGIVTALAYVPVAIWFEERRADLFDTPFRTDYVTFQAGAGLIMASLVGWLVSRIHLERRERRAPRRGGRGAARRARPPRRPPRRRQSLCASPQLVARSRRGLDGVHPRAARARALRSHGDRARRGRRRARDRDRGCAGERGDAPRHASSA